MSFKKVERSYFSSPSGWRLATYDEVKNGLKDDKVQSLLNKWDRVRLLDGWILGPGYDFQRGKDLQIGNDFRGCLGFMLLIRTQSGERFTSGSAYVDVNLTEFGKEVALFLCVDDWNYEVVYWLLNSWSNSNTMDLADVREETLAFSDAAKFIERSRMMGSLARRLGAEGGTALEKAEKKRYSGIDSVKDVLSGMIKLVTEERDVAQLIGGGIWHFRGYDGHEYCLTKSVEYDGVDAAFWSFVCDSFAGFVVEVAALESLICVRNMKTICPSEKNFNIATSILLYLSDYRSDIIHAPLAHKCRGSCAFKILKYAMVKAAGDGQSFMDILQNNPMWRCYDDPTGNYHLVDKLLVILARGNYIDLEGEEEKVEALVVNRLLECRAQPGEAYAIGKHKYETALHHAATSKNVRHGIQVAESLLRKCESVDATDERGRTALHRASKWGRARICELLLDKGATVGLQDEYGKTALHYVATCNSEDESEDEDKDDDDRMNVAKILLRKCDEKQRGLLANAADKKGRTALHRASKKGHAHMCQLFIDNSATVDAINKDGKTALHYAATSFYKDNGMKVAECLLGKVDGNEREVFTNMKDVKGRTALLRAAETGKARICQLLLRYGATLDVRDDNGQTPLHGAVEERQKEVIDVFMEHPHITESIDVENNSGDSPFDIAVAYNNIEIAAKLLSKSKQSEAHFNKIDPVDLLRCSLVDGYSNIVAKLLKKGTKLPEADDGKIGLHLAVACDEEDKARDLVRIVLQAETQGKQQNMVAKPDKKGRTVLHDAALNGYCSICVQFLRINPSIIYTKSKDGQNPLYDAVKGKFKGVDLLQRLLKEYFKKDKDVDDLLDRRGLTPLHVAVSEGKTELVTELLSNKKIREKYLSRGDIIGQTALHKAAKRGDSKTVTVLLNHGADPLNERDCDGRTALHYAVQSEAEGNKTELADLILKGCKSEEEKLLLLWASAAGLGTADDNLSDADPLHKFLLGKKNEIRQNLGTGNLLKTAASLGNIEMTKELITRGYQIEDIHDKVWRGRLESENKKNVDTVSKQIENIREQANDQPTVSDNLGRSDYAQGLAALFLNPYLKPPIAVGISGSWGMGKSSLMVQTESLLLTTAAQMALLTSSKLSVSALKLPDISPFVLSKKGESKYEKIERQINEEIGRRSNYGQKINKNMFTRFLRVFLSEDEHGKKITLPEFLQKYDLKYHNIFKSLAAMDSSYMFTTKAKEDQQPERSRLKSLWDMVKFKRNAEQLEGEFSGDGNAEQLEGEFSGRDGNASVASQEKTNAQHSMADVLGEGNVPAVLTVQYNAWKYRNETEALAGIAVEISREIEGTMTKSQWLNTCWRNTWKKKKYAIFIEIIFPCLLTIALAFSITLIVWIILDKYKLREWAKAKYACLPVAIVITVWTLTKSLMGILKPVSTQLMNFISFPDHSDKLGYQERVISDISFLKDEIGRSPHWLFIVLSWVFTMLAVLWRLITESWVTSLLFNHSRLEISLEVPEVAPASGNNLRIIVFVDDLDRCNESVILQVLSAVNLVLAVCQINVVIGMDKRLIERAIIKKYGDAKANKSSKAGQGLAEMYLQKIIQLPLDLPDPSEEQSRKFLEGQLGVFEEKEIEDKASVPGDNREIEAVQQNTGAPELAIDITEMGNVKKSSSSILIREMLFVRYSQGELDAFCYFQKLATDCRKLPREWKRLLNYHRLVWYIFSLSKEAKVLLGWQVQLITWIFICWEWKENVNFIIENWRNIPALRNSGSNAHVSLLMIVEYFMEENERDKNMKMTTTAEEAEGTGDKRPESSKRENEKSPDATDGIKEITTKPGGVHTKSTDNSENREMVLEGRMDTLEKTLVELKKEMKELKEMVSDELKKEMNELKQQVSDEMKKDISELKKQIVYLKSGKKEKTGEEKKIKLHNVSNWDKMKSALERYDVPMDGIQAFQRFRFYCIAGYLPRHLTTG